MKNITHYEFVRIQSGFIYLCPSYLIIGKNRLIEKSKVKDASEDIRKM